MVTSIQRRALRLRSALASWQRWARSAASYHLKGSRQPLAAWDSAAGRFTGCDTNDLGRFVRFRLLPVVGVFPFPPHELMLMCAAVVCLRPKLIVEWGTHIGISARVFWEVSRRYKVESKIHSIDLPQGAAHREHPGRRRGLLVRGCGVVLHEGKGLDVACEILHRENARRPLVFIDGDHERETVLREARTLSEGWPDAALLFHDTYTDAGDGERCGPAAAWQALAGVGRRYVIVEAGLGKPGMTLCVPA